MASFYALATIRLVQFWILAARAQQSLLGTRGYTECPCIDPQLMQYSDSTWSSKCSDPSKPILVTIDGVDYCYPASYGASTCQRHDMNLEPSCNHPRNAPAWCSKAWCYVDPNACQYNHKSSVYTPYANNVVYSYGACGEANLFGDWTVSKALRNVTLSVHVLAGEEPLWEFYREVLKEAEANYKIVSLRPFNGSAYTACVQDVSVGAVDLCVGNFWETASRRELTNFISPIAGDMFYLLTKKVEAGKNINIWSWMDPFTGTLWILIVVTIVVVGFAIFAVERRVAGDGHADFSSTDVLPGIAQSVYLSFSGFLAAGTAHTPSTPAGKVILIGFGLFLLLMISSYTANLASFLVVARKDTAAISDVSDLLQKGHKMCIYESAASTFQVRHSPRPPNSQMLTVSNSQEGMEKLESGECIGFLNSDFENDPLLKQREHCNKIRVGLPAMSIWLSQPVKSEWLRPLSYWMVELVSKGVNERITEKYSVADQCALKREEDAAADEDAGKMDWDDFIGTFAVTYSMIAVAVVYRAFRMLAEWYSRQIQAASPPMQQEHAASIGAASDNELQEIHQKV